MGYDCVVCVKQVPDTSRITGEAMKADGTVNRAALPAVFNPDDLNALEAALEIKDALGAVVTVITMGPPAAVDILKHALFMGADQVILISDRRFAGADTLATSPVRFVRCVGPGSEGLRAGAFDAEPITQATFAIPDHWPYAIIEIEDLEGRRAWTNSLFV